MPQGPLGAPRFSNIGPISRSTREEIQREWDECPSSGKAKRICEEIKISALAILEGQGVFAEYDDLVSINSGSCFKVAERVFNEVDGVRVFEAGGGVHAWIEHDDLHYDAEVPTGVNNPLELPVFERVSPEVVVHNAQLEASMEGKEQPETVEQTIIDITERYES